MIRVLIGAILTAIVGVPFVWVLIMVIQSAMLPITEDPEGYPEVFGTVIDIVLFLPLVVGLVLFITGLRDVRNKRSQRMGASQ